MPEPSPRFAYRAFLSYSHSDRAWCDWLHKALETYRVPQRLVGTETSCGPVPRRLHPVFRDRDELPSAIDLNQRVQQALDESQWLVVICSPRSAASRWVDQEVLAFKRSGRADRILCLIVEGEPNASDVPGRETEECFCMALRHRIDESGAMTGERTEPIAADARAGKDGKGNALLKLVAGMLGVGFDALKQRELQRRNRRLAAVAALALAVTALTTVLAVFALISRSQAVAAQRRAVAAQHRAVVAQQAAERRQKQAEDLVDFMVGDLSNKLAAESKLDIMQAVDDKAMAYFASLPPTDINDTALAQRAASLYIIADVRRAEGQTAGALEAYRASIRISSKLAAEAPADVTRQLTLADTLSAMSVIYWDQRKLDEGLRVVESVRQVVNRALRHARDNPDLLKVLANNEHNAGIALEAAGRMGEADAVFRKELELQQSLLHRIVVKAGEPITDDLGSAHQDLGKLALLRGDLATTVSQMAAYDAFETRLSESHPKQNTQRFRMMLSHADHGYALALAGETDAGSRYLRQAVELAEALRAADARNADHAAIGAYFSTRFAQMQRADGDAAAAMKTNEKALATLAGVMGANPGNRAWQRWHAMAQIEKGTQARAAGRTETARVQAGSALRTLEPMLAANPEDRDVLLTLVTAKLLLASVEPDAAAAKTLREQALRSMQSVKIARGDPRLLALQVEAELALGRNAEAQALAKRLWSSGYRHFALVDVLRKAHIDYPRNPEFHAALAAAEPPDRTGTAPQPAAGGDDRR